MDYRAESVSVRDGEEHGEAAHQGGSDTAGDYDVETVERVYR